MKCDKELKPIKVVNELPNFGYEYDSIREIQQELISKMVEKINNKRELLILKGLELKNHSFVNKVDFYRFLKQHVVVRGSMVQETYYVHNKKFLEISFHNTIDNPIGFSQKDIEVKFEKKYTYKFL